MALLPIIYMSILITAGLIITVILFSYISSKLRNRGNEDRILAIAYSGNNISNRTQGKTNRIQLQTRTRQKEMIQRKPDLKVIEKRSENEREIRQRVTRIVTNDIERKELKYSNHANTYLSETKSSTQKHKNRVEVLNDTLVGESKTTISSGEVKKNAFKNTDPLFYYSENTNENFYTIKAS